MALFLMRNGCSSVFPLLCGGSWMSSIGRPTDCGRPTLRLEEFRRSYRSDVHRKLRSFYLLVHPDLFGQYPIQRNTNEKSLQKLNEYIQKKEQGETIIVPLALTFFAKKPTALDASRSQQELFSSIKVTLNNNYIGSLVHLLRQCGLSTRTIKESDLPSKDSSNTGSGWSKAKRDVFSEMGRIRPLVTLRSWTQKNVPKARILDEESKGQREESEKVRRELLQELKVKDIQWNCGWSPTFFLSCLESLRKVAGRSEDVRNILMDRIVIFGTSSGVKAQGDIVLSTSDVPNMWHRFLLTVHQAQPMLEWIPAAEITLSSLLGGMKVSSNEGEAGGEQTSSRGLFVGEYQQHLARLLRNLEPQKERLLKELSGQCLEKLEMRFPGSGGDLRLSPDGLMLFPSSAQADHLIQFVNKHKDEAERRLARTVRDHERSLTLRDQALTEYQLSSLTGDPNLRFAQLITCYQSLLDNPYEVRVPLHGLRVRVSPYFMVLSDGLVCIHWNWGQDSR